HAGSLIDVVALPRDERDLLDDLDEEARQLDLLAAAGPRLLIGDLDRMVEVPRVVREDLAVDAIFERRDDIAAIRVVLRIGGEREQHVERDPDRESADLHI